MDDISAALRYTNAGGPIKLILDVLVPYYLIPKSILWPNNSPTEKS